MSVYLNRASVVICSAGDGWGDLREDRGLVFFLGFDHDLVGDLAAMDLDITREIKRDTDTLALDRGDPYHPDGVLWVSDDNFFAFAACNDQHPWLQSPARIIAGR